MIKHKIIYLTVIFVTKMHMLHLHVWLITLTTQCPIKMIHYKKQRVTFLGRNGVPVYKKIRVSQSQNIKFQFGNYKDLN